MPRITSGGADPELDGIAPEELLSAAIPVVRRGYAPEVVDGLLDRAATTIERLRASDDPELEHRRREQADLLHRTLLMAQASADQRIAEAESLAASVLEEARARAGRVVADAERAASHLVEAERTRAERTVGEALAHRQVLQADIDALERFAQDLRARLRSTFETQAVALDRALADAIADRPAVREIDLTDPTFARPVRVDDESAWWPAPGGPGTGVTRVLDQERPMALLADEDARTA